MRCRSTSRSASRIGCAKSSMTISVEYDMKLIMPSARNLRHQEQPMHIEALHAPRRSTLIRFVAIALLLTLAACSQLSNVSKSAPSKSKARAQLSIGYSLLYQEADGIPKLKWIFMFKDKPEEMGRVTNDLVSYYQQLADTMQRLSKQYPAMRIDVAAMSEIESDERKAIGADLAACRT